MFKLWQTRKFFNEDSKGYVPVSTVLNDEKFDLRQCLDIIRGILKCLFGLHARGLTQKELVLDYIYIKKTSVSMLSPPPRSREGIIGMSFVFTSLRLSVHLSVRNIFVSAQYLLNPFKSFHLTLVECLNMTMCRTHNSAMPARGQGHN